MFHGNGKSVEEDEDDNEPVEPLLLHRFPDPKPHFFLVHPEIRVLFELLLQSQSRCFFLLEQFWMVEGEQTECMH